MAPRWFRAFLADRAVPYQVLGEISVHYRRDTAFRKRSDSELIQVELRSARFRPPGQFRPRHRLLRSMRGVRC